MKLHRALLAASFISVPALAEEPEIVTYPPGEDRIEAVTKGASAPYAGQLFDENTALRWAFFLQQYKLRYNLDLKAAQNSCKVVVAREQEYRSIDAERSKKVEEDLRQRLLATEKARLDAEEKLRSPSFWKEPGLWYSVGVMTAVVAVIATAAATK